MRALKIITKDGGQFYSADWCGDGMPGLLDAIEQQAEKYAGGVERMELVKMTQEEYQAIPATCASARLFQGVRERP